MGSNCHEAEREMCDSFYIVSSLGTALRVGRWHMNSNQNSAKVSYLRHKLDLRAITWKGNTWNSLLIHTSAYTLYFDCNSSCHFRKWDIQLCFPTLWDIESEESSLNILIRYLTSKASPSCPVILSTRYFISNHPYWCRYGIILLRPQHRSISHEDPQQ